MKRILSLLLTLLLLLSLCSCGVSGDNPQMAAPSQTVAESTEPLFWPPLPTETEQTEPIETTAATEATEPVQRPSTGGKPTVTQKPSGDTDATYIPREDEEQVSFSALGEQEVLSTLRSTPLETLTPLQALNLLNELKEKL